MSVSVSAGTGINGNMIKQPQVLQAGETLRPGRGDPQTRAGRFRMSVSVSVGTGINGNFIFVK